MASVHTVHLQPHQRRATQGQGKLHFDLGVHTRNKLFSHSHLDVVAMMAWTAPLRYDPHCASQPIFTTLTKQIKFYLPVN